MPTGMEAVFETFLLLAVGFCAAADNDSQRASQLSRRAECPDAGDDVEPILIDWIHANDFSMIGLQPGVYSYHVLCGFRRGLEYLASRGYRGRYAVDGPLTAAQLTPHQLLFINLVSAEREPFLVSEIAAIRAFVSQGGSLFVVTDHSNAYFHSHRLKPLLASLGIRSSTSTACDEAPFTLGESNVWITVTKFQEHPVTRGLRTLALQTGGCVDRRYAVAWTSDRSWADAWSAGLYGEENAPGFLGDTVRGPDEQPGPLGVVLARTLGAGRIVIVADQNMFADGFINYADNYRLWLNIMAWLLHAEALHSSADYEGWQSPRIALLEQYPRATFGDTGRSGYYHAQVLINRQFWALTGDVLPDFNDLIVLAHNDYELSGDQLAAVARHLKARRNVVLLNCGERSLEDRQGVVGCVLRELSALETPVIRLPDRQRVEIPAGGRIDVLLDESTLDNTGLPSPTTAPNDEQQQRIELLLSVLRDALPKRTASPAEPGHPE